MQRTMLKPKRRAYAFPVPLKTQIRRFPLKEHVRPYVVRLRHQSLTQDDVVIASYPRSGSTWLRFILFEILSGEEAGFESVNRAIPSVGWHRDAAKILPNGGRLMQSHERFTGSIHRAIYIVRDVRSVVVSEYRLSRMYGYSGDFSRFMSDFIGGQANAFGTSWKDHVHLWLDSSLAASNGLLLLRYEDMRSNIQQCVENVLDFLGITRDPQTVLEAIQNNDLLRMRIKEDQAPAQELHKRNSSIRFVGEGSISDWKEELRPQDVQAVERRAASAMDRLGYKLNGSLTSGR
jgi:hypothetical protein